MSEWEIGMPIQRQLCTWSRPLDLVIDYASRGWTHFERSLSELIKGNGNVSMENIQMLLSMVGTSLEDLVDLAFTS